MNDFPILCVVGASGSGKTTLIERLIPLLKARGLRVGVLKRTHHDVPIDLEGKDTWRHAQAGAEQVLLLGPSKMAYMDYREEERSPESVIRRHFEGVDLALVEGFRSGELPKLEVWRQR